VPLLEQVLEKYPKEVKLVFKNFPLRNHTLARPAAVAALAAGEQGKFWEYHDRLFENYQKISEPLLVEIAGELGLDTEAFQAAREMKSLGASVSRDMQEGSRAGVRGTPTVFINGRRLNQRSLAGFSAMIDGELQRTGKEVQ
jgi:protein-disulfide isomerase